MIMPTPWFRFYSETLYDRKVRRIIADTGMPKLTVMGAWTTVLVLASDSPVRGTLLLTESKPYTLQQIADEMETTLDMAETLIDEFIEYGMIHQNGSGVYSLCNWDKRQFSSDNSQGRVREYRDRRKGLGLRTTASYESSEIIARWGACVYCGSAEHLCVDHVIPISQGGTDNPLNLVAACKKCNSGKAGRTPEQAGYAIIDREASAQYKQYSKNLYNVTVTETAANSDCNLPDTEQIRTDTDNAHTRTTDDSLSDVQRQYLTLFGAKRFKNNTQRDALRTLEDDYGGERLLDAARWAATKGMTLGDAIGAIQRALPKWGNSRDATGPPGASGPRIIEVGA